VSNIRSSGESGVRKERSILRDKIDRLNQEIKQYENNMGIFTGKGAENMRKEIEKKIKSAQREISEIKEKMALLNEE
jgi:predicted DNA-binding protein YlxM (UPF0122 family)